MVSYYGDFAEDDTVNIPFNTFSSDDPSDSVTATDLILSDIYVHKDGSATAITTDGATVDVDAPGVGAHMITIDTSVDAAYAVGSEYAVRVDGVTVDGGTVNAWIGAFSIERAGGVLALIKAGNLSANMVQLGGSTQSATDLKDFADEGYDPATDKITGCLLTDTITTYTNNTPQSADNDTKLTTIAADVVNVDGYNLATQIGTAGAGLTNLGASGNNWNTVTPDAVGVAATQAEVATEAALALTNIHMDHLMATAAADVIVDGSVIAHMVSATEDWSTFVPSDDSLQAIRDRGDAEWITATGFATPTNITAGIITTVTNLTNAATSGDLTATMKTSVNTEVDNALNVTTYAEPGQGAPAATATIQAKIGYLYKAWRNKSFQNATEYRLYNDDTTTIDQKATVSDDATDAIKGEVGTGA